MKVSKFFLPMLSQCSMNIYLSFKYICILCHDNKPYCFHKNFTASKMFRKHNVTNSDGFNVRWAWSEISRGAAVKHFVVFFEGGYFDIFCGSYLDITWHLLESCFTAFLRRAAFTAYFEAAFFAAFFRGSCFVAFLVVDALRHFLGGAAL